VKTIRKRAVIEKERESIWLIFSMIWRSISVLSVKKHGDKVFHIGGIKNQMDSWRRG